MSNNFSTKDIQSACIEISNLIEHLRFQLLRTRRITVQDYNLLKILGHKLMKTVNDFMIQFMEQRMIENQISDRVSFIEYENIQSSLEGAISTSFNFPNGEEESSTQEELSQFENRQIYRRDSNMRSPQTPEISQLPSTPFNSSFDLPLQPTQQQQQPYQNSLLLYPQYQQQNPLSQQQQNPSSYSGQPLQSHSSSHLLSQIQSNHGPPFPQAVIIRSPYGGNTIQTRLTTNELPHRGHIMQTSNRGKTFSRYGPASPRENMETPSPSFTSSSPIPLQQQRPESWPLSVPSNHLPPHLWPSGYQPPPDNPSSPSHPSVPKKRSGPPIDRRHGSPNPASQMQTIHSTHPSPQVLLGPSSSSTSWLTGPHSQEDPLELMSNSLTRHHIPSSHPPAPKRRHTEKDNFQM